MGEEVIWPEYQESVINVIEEELKGIPEILDKVTCLKKWRYKMLSEFDPPFHETCYDTRSMLWITNRIDQIIKRMDQPSIIQQIQLELIKKPTSPDKIQFLNEWRFRIISRYDRVFHKHAPTMVESIVWIDSMIETIKKTEDDLAMFRQNDHEKSGNHKENKLNGHFKLVRRSKTDLIRLLDAMYTLGMIQQSDVEQTPTKEDWMAVAGQFFGVDLSDDHASLSQAMRQSLDANLKIFNDLRDKFEENWHKSQEKERKKT